MSMIERTGNRNGDLLYSRWHRTSGDLGIFLGQRDASRLHVIDIDWCEYCDRCRTPLALIETQISRHPPKPAPVTERLARMAGIPAFSVSIEVINDSIAAFRLQQIAPEVGRVELMDPESYGFWLWVLREDHRCSNLKGDPE